MLNSFQRLQVDLEISTLPKLQHLSLKHNRLDYLPAHLARLYPHLKLIALEGNPCYDSLLPRRVPIHVEPRPTPARSSLRRLPSFPRLRHSKSVPNIRRSRSKTLSAMTIRESKELSPDPQRKSFLKQITAPLPPLPTFSPRRPPRPPAEHSVIEGLRRVRGTAEVVGIARDTEWPVGPTPQALTQKVGGSRDSDASGESDSNSSIDGSSPASSISSPLNNDVNKNILPLYGIDEIDLDQRELTVRLLSRLRDLWELSNGDACLSDHYTPPEPEESLEIDEFAQGLGITLESVDTKQVAEEQAAAEVSKKAVGETSVKRMKIVKEIIDTEESYIRGLQELADVLYLLLYYLTSRYTSTTSFPHYHPKRIFESSSDMSKRSSISTKTSFFPHSSKQMSSQARPMIKTVPLLSAMQSAQSSKKKQTS